MCGNFVIGRVLSVAPSKHVNTKGCGRTARRGGCRGDPWATSCFSRCIINGQSSDWWHRATAAPGCTCGYVFSFWGIPCSLQRPPYSVFNPHTPPEKAVTRPGHAVKKKKKILLAASASKPVARPICVCCCRFNAALCFFFFFSDTGWCSLASWKEFFCWDIKDSDLEPCRQGVWSARAVDSHFGFFLNFFQQRQNLWVTTQEMTAAEVVQTAGSHDPCSSSSSSSSSNVLWLMSRSSLVRPDDHRASTFTGGHPGPGSIKRPAGRFNALHDKGEKENPHPHLWVDLIHWVLPLPSWACPRTLSRIIGHQPRVTAVDF